MPILVVVIDEFLSCVSHVNTGAVFKFVFGLHTIGTVLSVGLLPEFVPVSLYHTQARSQAVAWGGARPPGAPRGSMCF